MDFRRFARVCWRCVNNLAGVVVFLLLSMQSAFFVGLGRWFHENSVVFRFSPGPGMPIVTGRGREVGRFFSPLFPWHPPSCDALFFIRLWKMAFLRVFPLTPFLPEAYFGSTLGFPCPFFSSPTQNVRPISNNGSICTIWGLYF